MSEIEVTLAVLPELTSHSLEAFVSLNRIEKFLNAEEIEDFSEPSDGQIDFVDATFAWPLDSKESQGSDRFVLQNVSITFPPNELSVISGKTGSGKSLLLAAVLGEVDKLKGLVRKPVSPPLAERFDASATKGNWILPSAVAYVSQTPWIENASVRDNILFGLPLDQGRYKATIKVCALEPDLELLTDGDETEVGGSGINLSGGMFCLYCSGVVRLIQTGQRWRIAFARALYSRAG